MKWKWQCWDKLSDLSPKEFICGFCGQKVACHKGYIHSGEAYDAFIFICPNCGRPTFFDWDGVQHPGPSLGRKIENLPDDIKTIYFEISESIKNNCPTAAILLGRKLIMHIAVNVAEAREGENFTDYITHLQNSNYIPPKAEKWLDYMRELGNQKNHEVKIANIEEAEKILKFIEMLLIFIYEFPAEFEE